MNRACLALGALMTVWATATADTAAYLTRCVGAPYRLRPEEIPFAHENVRLGYRILGQVLAGTYLYYPDPGLSEAHTAAVAWALFDAAVAKGQGFEQGAFVVEDPDGRLFSFFRDNERSYQRLSSHLKPMTRRTGVGHHGLDMRGARPAGLPAHPDAGEHALLPARKRTLLFIPMLPGPGTGLERRHLFLKLEDHGLEGLGAFIRHGFDYLHTTVMGFGSTPPERARKERVDPALARAYRRLLDHISAPGRAHLTPASYGAAELGVRAMVAEWQRLKPVIQEDPALFDLGRAFAGALAHKRYDHLDVRTGDEVIFSRAELGAAVETHREGAGLGREWLEDDQDWELEADPGPVPASLPPPAPKAGWGAWAASWF